MTNLEEIIKILNTLPENFDLYLDDKSIENLMNGKFDDLTVKINNKENKDSKIVEDIVWMK